MKLRIRKGVHVLKGLKHRGRKSLSLLPHIFTLGNLVAGVVSIILTLQGQYRLGALMVFLSMAFDGVDGRVARWLKADGEFGKQMDSLADLVAFGVAPALLMYEVNLKHLDYWGWVITSIFPVAGALRLARFNLLKVSGYFVGLPITAGGGLMASFIVYGRRLDHWAFSAATLAIAYLMVSNIRYPDFKKTGWGKIRLTPILLPTVATLLILRASPRTVIFLPLLIYAASGLYLHLGRSWQRLVAPRIRDLALRMHRL